MYGKKLKAIPETKMGFTDNVRRKNRLLIAATLGELSSEGKQSAILETLCEKLLGFAKKP
jgi:hypothetical protein